MRKIHSDVANLPRLKTRRKELRTDGTPAEAVLWNRLQRRQVLGKKFRRQFSVGPYIVDFFCVECNLAIEVDGAVHHRILREDYETERTEYLEGLGISILRFENRAVFRNIEGVVETIREEVVKRS